MSDDYRTCCGPEYIHINSAHRDRSQNPLTTDFMVNLRRASTEPSTYAEKLFTDPVIDGLPMLIGQFDSGAGGNTAILPAGIAPPRTDDLVGGIIEIPGNLGGVPNTHLITDYNATTRTISIAPDSWAVNPSALDSFIIDYSGVSDYIQHSGVINGYTVSSQDTTDVVVTIDSAQSVSIGSVIFIDGLQPRLITGVSGNVITVSEQWGSVISANAPYFIRRRRPYVSGIFTAVGATPTTTFRLAATEPSTDDAYTNYYIMVIDRDSNGLLPTLGTQVAAHGQIRRIISYTGSTREVVVSPPFSSDVTTDYGYRIWPANENASGVISGNRLHEQTKRLGRCAYKVKLTQLIIPNLPVIVPSNKYDGQITMNVWSLPYIVVHIEPSGISHASGIMSNSSAADGALCIVGMENVSNTTQPFLYLSNINIAPEIDISGWSSFRIRLSLPSGEPLQFTVSDTKPPSYPNYHLQVSGIIEFCLSYCYPSTKDLPRCQLGACTTHTSDNPVYQSSSGRVVRR